tara:strand:- start:739 stop:1080 length:342 start_codon:yes stop_codon:yes gene_type:complete
MSDDLQPVVINLNTHKEGALNESWLAMFGGAIEMILKRMFDGDTGVSRGFRTAVRGTPSQVSAFGDALGKEKKYMETFLKHGLNDPRSFNSKADLNKAIANFERETGIKWPFN